MNTKQLTWPSIEIQKQFWINKEAVSNNATPETRADKLQEVLRQNLPVELCREYDGAAEHFARHGELPQLMGSPGALDWINADPEAFEQRVREMKYGLAMETTHARHQITNGNSSTTADPKPEELSRTESLTDWYDHGRNDFDRGDLLDEGRNPDGSGESLSERNH